MNDEQPAAEQPEPTGQAPPQEPGRPDEEELRARLEDQLKQIRVQDLLLESVASILNLAARRIAKDDERDLDQGRLGIDAVRAVVDLLDEGPREQVREALSQVQMLYVRETRSPAGDEGGGEAERAPGEAGESPPEPDAPRPGPEPPPRLWTPPGTG